MTLTLTSEPNPCVRHNSTYSTTVQKINRYTCHHSLPWAPFLPLPVSQDLATASLLGSSPMPGTGSLLVTLMLSSSNPSAGNAFPQQGQREPRRVAFKINFQEYRIKSLFLRKRKMAAERGVFPCQCREVSPFPFISCKGKTLQTSQPSLGGIGRPVILCNWVAYKASLGKTTWTRLLKSDPRCPITIRYWWLRTFWNFSQRK